MKVIFTLLLLALAVPVMGQETPPPPAREENSPNPPTTTVVPPPPPPVAPKPPIAQEPVVDFPDKEARFKGGQKGLQRYISNNIQYPEVSIEMGEQGTVYLSFVVEKDGSVTNVKVERGVSRGLDREAKRVIRKMPKWKPGKVKRKKVRTRCRLPIRFTLE